MTDMQTCAAPKPYYAQTRHNVCRCACYWCHRSAHCHGEFCKS